MCFCQRYLGITSTSARSKKITENDVDKYYEELTPMLDDRMIPDIVCKDGDSAYPYFMIEGKGLSDTTSAEADLVKKLKSFDERNFDCLPFFLTLALSPKSAQFMVSHKGNVVPEKVGDAYLLDSERTRTMFLLAFLNCVPLFDAFTACLGPCNKHGKPVWRMPLSSSSGTVRLMYEDPPT
jgi:hypothetical protein